MPRRVQHGDQEVEDGDQHPAQTAMKVQRKTEGEVEGHAEGDELGLIVVGGQLLARVGEREAQHPDREQVQAGVDQQPPVVVGVAGQIMILGSSGSRVVGMAVVARMLLATMTNLSIMTGRHEDIGPVVAAPAAVGTREASGPS